VDVVSAVDYTKRGNPEGEQSDVATSRYVTPQEWAMKERLDALVEAARPVVTEMRSFIKDGGGCDHSVGICWCDSVRMVDALDEAINNATKGESNAKQS
jgi:hypothetical protein